MPAVLPPVLWPVSHRLLSGRPGVQSLDLSSGALVEAGFDEPQALEVLRPPLVSWNITDITEHLEVKGFPAHAPNRKAFEVPFFRLRAGAPREPREAVLSSRIDAGFRVEAQRAPPGKETIVQLLVVRVAERLDQATILARALPRKGSAGQAFGFFGNSA